MKNTIIAMLALIILAGGGYYYFVIHKTKPTVSTEGTAMEEKQETEPEEMKEKIIPSTEVIGRSVKGSDITAYHYTAPDSQNVDTELLFVGGIHGGYEWNTPLVAYELMDYLKADPSVIPTNVEVTVIPVLNPDGLFDVVGTTGRFTAKDVIASDEEKIQSRFNTNGVDLNRNFDCDWKTTGVWQNREVDGGDKPFSEPESRVIRDYVENHSISAAVVWYSAAGGVFASNCHNGVSDETLALTNLYADASGYKPYESFDFYKVTGDMVNWLAKNDIPAISVLLSTHDAVEWDKNKKGIDALLDHYRK